MGKGLLAAVAASVVVGAGYIAGVILTGQQVDEQFQREVAAAQEHFRAVAKISSAVKSTIFSSSNTLSIEYLQPPEAIAAWAGTNTVHFDVDFKHGFLNSQSVMQLSAGSLLDKLKSYQVNSQLSPVVFNSEYRFDPANGSVVMSGNLALDSFEINEGGGVFKLGATNGPISTSYDGYQIDLVTVESRFDSADGSIEIGPVSWSQTAESRSGDLLAAESADSVTMSVKVQRIKLDSQGAAVDLKALSVAVQQKLKGDRVVLGVQYGAERIIVKNADDSFQLDQPDLQLSFDLDHDSVLSLVERLQQMQQANAGQIENPMLLVPLLSEVTQKGVSFNVDRLSAIANGETLEALAKLKVAPFSVEELMLDPQVLLSKVDLDAQLSVPKKFLQAMPGYDPQQLGFFVAMGFIVDTGDSYDFELAVENGVLMLNGEEMPGL